MKYYKFIFTMLISVILGFTSLTSQVGLNPQVGQNYMFWIRAQGFFSGYYQSSATLIEPGVGDNCYIFTEDALVRDIAISPFEDSLLVASTNSGIFVSTDYGATWQTSYGSGTKLLPLEPAPNLQNIPEKAPQHLNTMHTITFESQDYWWVGTEGVKGAYQSKDRGAAWSQKGSGMPTFDPDGPDNPLPNDNPPVYKVYFPIGGEDAWAATLAGLFFRPGSRWSLRGSGLPDPATTDWPSIPVYDVLIHDSIIVAGTENGLFRGDVSEEFDNTLPIEGGTVTIDTTFLTFVTEEVLDSTKTDSFYIDPTSDSTIIIDDITLNVSWVYEYTTSIDTLSWNLTLGLSDTSSAGLSLAVGQILNIVDDSTGTMWKGKVTENSDLDIFIVDLINEQVYFFDDALFDDNEPDSTTYKNYNTNHLIVYKGGGEAVTDITVDSNGLIYYTTATGAYSVSINGGTPTSLGLSNVTINDIALSADENVLYAATTQGLQKIEIGSSPDWIEITPHIHMLTTEDSLSYVTNSIAVVGNDTIYVACGTSFFADPRLVTYKTGGILASFDGGSTWSPKNVGLTHRSATVEDVANIRASFDSTTAADATKGLYEFLTTWYGSPPDVDNDDKIVILFADMDDNAYNATDDLVIQGYFNPADQSLTDIQPNSNQLDIIYLDSDPQDPGEGQEGLARALSRLISYNYDPDEEEWVLIGLEHFASYIAGNKTMPDDSLFKISNNNSLMYGDNEDMNVEFDQSFTIMEYLYEHYLNEDPFSLSPDPIKSMSAIVHGAGSGTIGLDSVLSLATGGAKDFSDVFTEWALAIHFDNPDNSWNDGLYGFSNIDVSIAVSPYPWGTTSGRSPYRDPISNWAARFNQSEKWKGSPAEGWVDKAPDFNNETLVFNGSDASDITLVVIKQVRKGETGKDSTASIEYVELDDIQNRAIYTNWSDFGSDSAVVTDSSHLKKYQYFAVIVVCRDAGVESGGSYVVDDEMASPDIFSLQVDQNTDLTNYLDIYSFSDVPIYGDGAVSVDSDLEGPRVEISDGDSIVNSFTLPSFYNANDGYMYRQTFDMNSLLPTMVSEFLFIGSAESIGGNAADSDSILVVAIKVSSSVGKFIASKLGGFSISISPDAIEHDDFITVIEKSESDLTPESVMPIGDVLTLGPSSLVLEKGVTIEFDLSGMDLTSIDIEKLDIVSINDGKATSLAAIVDKENWVVSADVPEMGSIQLVVNPAKRGVDILPTEYALYQNYPNPFNPTTNLRFDLPEEAFISLKLYDVLGREVVDLSPGFLNAGIHTIGWSGLDNRGKKVATGVYFYRLKSSNFTKTKKMLLVK